MQHKYCFYCLALEIKIISQFKRRSSSHWPQESSTKCPKCNYFNYFSIINPIAVHRTLHLSLPKYQARNLKFSAALPSETYANYTYIYLPTYFQCQPSGVQPNSFDDLTCMNISVDCRLLAAVFKSKARSSQLGKRGRVRTNVVPPTGCQ